MDQLALSGVSIVTSVLLAGIEPGGPSASHEHGSTTFMPATGGVVVNRNPSMLLPFPRQYGNRIVHPCAADPPAYAISNGAEGASKPSVALNRTTPPTGMIVPF